MAIPNLFQKSDANLSAMAYKMSEAKTPGDHSLIYHRMAQSYRSTMLNVGNVWDSVIKAATPFIKEAAGNFAEKSKYQTLMGQEKYENSDNVNHFLNGMDLEIDNPDFISDTETPGVSKTTTSRYKGLNEISKELRNTWLEGNPLSQENKTKRMQLNKEKDQLYADVDLLEAGFAHIGETINSGNYSEDALKGVYGDSRFIAAASAFNNSSGKADNGDYLIPSRDKNGNLILGLYGKDGRPVNKMANQPEHGFVSYKASEIGDLVTPDFPKLRASGSKLFDGVIQSIAKGGNAEIEGNKFQNNLSELVRDPKALQYALYEKRFSHFQTSFVDDLMANKGQSSDLSATLYQSILDALGTDRAGNAQLPTDENGNPIDIDLGTNEVFDASDFSDPAIGLDNYTKFASAIQNKHNPYYNEELTRGVFLHWARDKAMQQAQVVRGQTPKPKIEFENDFREEQNASSATARGILQAAQVGDFTNLVLPPLNKGGAPGIITWNPKENKYQVERNDEVASKPFSPTNFNLERLMLNNGVLPFQIEQMKNLGHFNQPIWNPKKGPVRNPYGARNTELTGSSNTETETTELPEDRNEWTDEHWNIHYQTM